ncbi:hypothetical protein EDD41_0408 [Luteococcus japonicus]|uniref:Uncharacterized protein n=1 Tax=Luteococcus japonicus TaxID=33984 RepID=A0A3N1ZQT8_9ACTN|nr:hypothetical protein [Luteococcus japonicus]ROR53273.1 hypothetical protein EDD41_0408 [Luteococcus japonicus]
MTDQWLDPDQWTIDFTVSVTCDHRNPDTGTPMSDAPPAVVYQHAHVVPTGLRIGYSPWRVPPGPWAENFQSNIEVWKFRGVTREEFWSGSYVAEHGIPKSRHDITCDDCGTIVPLLDNKFMWICDQLMQAGLDKISLHGLKLAAQAAQKLTAVDTSV